MRLRGIWPYQSLALTELFAKCMEEASIAFIYALHEACNMISLVSLFGWLVSWLVSIHAARFAW